jgi:ferredoxin-NADP reductase/uncharacterized protein YcbX/ferredoxin
MNQDHPGERLGTLEAVTRFPVKGLPGTRTPSAWLEPGRGLGFDRVLAITTGDETSTLADEWRPRAAFHHLAKNAGLVHFGTQLSGPLEGGDDLDEPGARVRLTVTSPQGAQAVVHFPDPDLEALDAAVSDWFPTGAAGVPTVVAPRARLWDWPEAPISLINLDTVAALEGQFGRPVDPRRFRGNLLVSGLPAWSEFALVGHVVSIGEAEFEVFQPTDRCRATTVDPTTGTADLNVPAQLAARFGHMFCGVYLRPRAAGRITVGDPIRIVPTGADSAARSAGPVAEPDWPRPAIVSARGREAQDVESFWFEDSAGLLPAARPGQHVRLHLPTEAAPNWRNYTISAVDGERVRITVKRGQGISALLHDTITAGRTLLVSGPLGPVQFDASDERPLVLVSAGIGITPTIAVLRALRSAGSCARVEVVHVDRTIGGIPLREELIGLVSALPGARLSLHLTGETDAAWSGSGVGSDHLEEGAPAGRIHRRRGRPGDDELAAAVARAAAGSSVEAVHAYLCGPGSFTDEALLALGRAGVERSRIHFDVFYTPALPDPEPMDPPLPGPFAVAFADGGAPAVWAPSAGSLLDLAEATGRDWPSACRSGACGTCENTLRSGTVAYLTAPVVTPPDGRILTCCAVPTSDVVIGTRPSPSAPADDPAPSQVPEGEPA